MARGQVDLTANVVETLLAGGSAYSGRRMNRGIIKNTGVGTVYLQWTTEDLPLSLVNGFPLDAGEILGFDLNREGPNSSQLCAPVYALSSGSSASVAYAFE